MTSYLPTPKTTLHRIPARGVYDRATVHAILDEALVCHLGFVSEGQPMVIPTTFARDGETLFVHGAAASRAMRALASGIPACATIALIDGIVLARSAFHHSVNYRSVVVLATATEVTAPDEKMRALRLFVEKMSPGRFAAVRRPTENELRATRVLAMPLDEVSAKVRVGPPLDDPADLDLPVWAGVLPIGLRPSPLQADPASAVVFDPPAFPIGLVR